MAWLLAFAAFPAFGAPGPIDVGFTRIVQSGDLMPGVSDTFDSLFTGRAAPIQTPPALSECRVAFASETGQNINGDVGIFLSEGNLVTVAPAVGGDRKLGHASIDGSIVAYGIIDPTSSLYTWDNGSSTLVAQGGVGGLPDFIVSPSIDQGSFAFYGQFYSPDTSSILLDTGGGAVIVADTNTDVPGLPPASTFTFLDGFTILDGGLVLFHGGRQIGLDPPEMIGLYTGNGGPLATIVDETVTIPGTLLPFLFLDALDLEAGTALFTGTDTAWSAGSAGGVYTGNGGPLFTVADYDTDIPEGTGKFDYFTLGSLDGGQVAFVGGNDGSPVQEGIYLFDGSDYHKIIDRTDTLDGKTPSHFRVGPEGLDGNRIAFSVRFEDLSEAIYIATIHAPTQLQAGAPVGTIVAWHEDLAGVPPLPPGWVRLDGQTLSDGSSPYPLNTQLPDLNGTGRFLRGGTCSGALQYDAMQGHWHAMSPSGGAERMIGSNVFYQDFNPAFNLVSNLGADIQIGDAITGNYGPVTTDFETRPKNLYVTWILKTRENVPLPVGSIIAWDPGLSSATPDLLPGWTPLDGATPLPPPFSGVLPNANGDARFLRAGSPTGTTQEDAIQGHRHDVWHNAERFQAGTGIGNGDFVEDFPAYLGVLYPISDGVHGTPRLERESRPANMSVVWMMKTADTPLPTGAILAWHRDLPGTPGLGRGAVELDGRVLDDPASPYDGETLPDLNDEGLFLRGGTTSGVTQQDALQGHYHDMLVNDSRYVSLADSVWGLPLVSGAPVFDDAPATVEPRNPTTDTVHGTPRVANETRPINMSVVWIMQVGYPAEAIAVPPLANSILGGSGLVGGIDFSFPGATPGSFTGTYEIVDAADAAAVLANPALLNFSIPTDPVQLWELSYDMGFTAPVTLTFGYDDAGFLPFFAEGSLEIYRYVPPFGGCVAGVDCEWIALPKTGQDLALNTITVQSPGFSQFVLGGPVVTGPSNWDFGGIAEGGSVDFSVGAVFLSVATSAGQSGAEVAANIAAAINGDATLAAAGITATATGTVVQTNGLITSTAINDPGLLHRAVPALPPWAAALLVAALMIATVWWAPRRRRPGPVR